MKNKYALLALAVFTFASIPVASAAFNDVSAADLRYDAIMYAQQNNIVSGYPDGDFKADTKINRAEFLKIVINANFSASDINACLTNNGDKALFSDTSNSEWYAKYLCTGKERGVISGYPDGTFKPAQEINFAEAAKIISIAKNGHWAGSSLNDASVEWYKIYVKFLADNAAIPATIQGLAYNITRGEMVEMIYRINTNKTDLYSLTYDQVVGSCIKAGQMAGGVVYPGAPQTACCTGLVDYSILRDRGNLLLGAKNSLCLEPRTGLQEAVDIMGTSNACTSEVKLGQSAEYSPYKNLNFNGFSFAMVSYQPLCHARCDVDLDTKEASIGWMCTGAIVNPPIVLEAK